jgi:hypothetical protein
MVPVAKTRALYAPRHPFSEWVTCGNEIAETTTNMSFGPKVVDWACSLRKTKKWFRCRAATKLRETTQTWVLDLK